MKLLLPLLTLVAISGAAVAQDTPAPQAPVAPVIPSTPIFKDVPPTHWAFAAVQRLAAAGIIEGYPSTAAPTTQVLAKVVPAAPTAAKVPAAKVGPAQAVKVAPKSAAKVAPKAVSKSKKGI
ncbi:hypothetical protein EON83_15975 [bacterium]|nr:MAG: hypothetical protein EON83_15975 [bacterium]